jgi:hypothetical protein
MFNPWVMLVIFFVTAIFAANLLVAPFSQNSVALCYTELAYSVILAFLIVGYIVVR